MGGAAWNELGAPTKKKAGGSKLRTGQVMGLEGEVSVVETVAENAGQLGLACFTVLLQRRRHMSGSRGDCPNCDRAEAGGIGRPRRGVVETLPGRCRGV
jgi:hypothetical protein